MTLQTIKPAKFTLPKKKQSSSGIPFNIYRTFPFIVLQYKLYISFDSLLAVLEYFIRFQQTILFESTENNFTAAGYQMDEGKNNLL